MQKPMSHAPESLISHILAKDTCYDQRIFLIWRRDGNVWTQIQTLKCFTILFNHSAKSLLAVIIKELIKFSRKYPNV